MPIDRLLEGTDLTVVHTILALFGALVSVYVMQLTRYEAEDAVDPSWLRSLRRFALALMAWAFLWSLSYSETKNWQPWPPEVLAIAAMDLILLIRALAIRARIKRTGHVWGTDIVVHHHRAVASTQAKQSARARN